MRRRSTLTGPSGNGGAWRRSTRASVTDSPTRKSRYVYRGLLAVGDLGTYFCSLWSILLGACKGHVCEFPAWSSVPTLHMVCLCSLKYVVVHYTQKEGGGEPVCAVVPAKFHETRVIPSSDIHPSFPFCRRNSPVTLLRATMTSTTTDIAEERHVEYILMR